MAFIANTPRLVFELENPILLSIAIGARLAMGLWVPDIYKLCILDLMRHSQ